MSKILDGKKLSQEIAENLKRKIGEFAYKPLLAIIQIGDVEASNIYIEHKKKFASNIGASVRHIKLDSDATEEMVIDEVVKLNNDDEVSGVIIQMPFPNTFNKRRVIDSIDPKKDVDGLTSTNCSKIFLDDDSGIVPATPKGIITLLKNYDIDLEGKRVIVIGKSLLVGKPLAMLLLKEKSTVTIAHSKTVNLNELIAQSDIVVVAVGKTNLVGRQAVRDGQVIIDVGINSVLGDKIIEEGDVFEKTGHRRVVGDVDFEEVKNIVGAISPVPGGVGPMTVASLFENLVITSSLNRQKR